MTQYIPRLTASEKNDKTPYINVNGSDHLKTLGTYYERGNIRVGEDHQSNNGVYSYGSLFHIQFPPSPKGVSPNKESRRIREIRILDAAALKYIVFSLVEINRL